MKQQPTKLKKMKLNSVDFVRRGANQAADIALYKSQDYTPEDDNQSFFKSISDGITNVLKKAFNGIENESTVAVDIAKAEQDLTMFTDILGESFSSIMKDDSLSMDEKGMMIQKSFTEFSDTLDGYMSSFGIETNNSILSKGDVTMADYTNIDKSLLSAEEAKQLDALLAKASPEPAGKVNPAKAEEEETENLPEEAKKSVEAIKALQEETAALKKSLEMKQLEEVAKKYSVLGKKPEELTKSLYDMKQAGEEVYKAYTGALDEQLSLVEKSGMFTEVGKSGSYHATAVAKSEPESKIEGIAKSYMEKDPSLDYNTAVAKAWENNPDLMAAYDAEYGN